MTDAARADDASGAEDTAVVDTGDDGARHTRQLRRSVISLVVLIVLVGALLLAVPGLRGVATLLRNAEQGWIAAAIGLELLSCFGYVLIFQLVFYRAPRLFAARLAWAEMAFGAAVSLGGAGGVALGAWVLRSVGVPAGRIAERSAVLFLATSAVNIFVLTLFALGIWTGVLDGPDNPLLSALPAAVGVVVLAFFIALPHRADRLAARVPGRRRVGLALRGMATTVRSTESVLFTPNWRLLGALAYLLCDIAVLWACFRALGPAPPLAVIVLAYQIGYLANLIPVPGGIGALDAGLVGMLVLYGAKATPAAAAVLAYHAIALWIPTLAGTVSFVLLRRMLRGPIEPRVPARQD